MEVMEDTADMEDMAMEKDLLKLNLDTDMEVMEDTVDMEDMVTEKDLL